MCTQLSVPNLLYNQNLNILIKIYYLNINRHKLKVINGIQNQLIKSFWQLFELNWLFSLKKWKLKLNQFKN